MRLAKCLELKYVEGSFDLVQGVKLGERDERLGDGAYFRNRGYGWGEIIVPSKLLLTVENDAGREECDIALFFKQNWGKLSKARRDALLATMPAGVSLTKTGVGKRSLQAWLQKARQAHVKGEGRQKRLADRREKLEREELVIERIFRQAEERRKERRKNALHLSFTPGWNPKYGTDQWQARHESWLYVLRWEDDYDPTEGAVPIEQIRELIPGRIALVRRIR